MIDLLGASTAARGAVFPLVDAGLTKADVRALSRHLGLRTWDKPAAACLASRIPYGTPVTLGRLRACPILHHKFVLLGHNTIRGAAGGSILNAELCVSKGYIR